MTVDVEKARALVERFKKYSDRPDFFGPITEQESDDAIDTITALLAEVERLIAENASIRTLMDCYNLGGWTDSLRLMQERDALARDAARYRWLSETTTFTDVIETAYSSGLTYHVRRWFHDSNDQFDTLEETVDAKMKGASDVR